MPRILVIGATGNVGRHVVERLRTTDASFRAMARNPEEAGFPPDVEVVRGDLTLPETLDPCLADMDAVFLVWTAPLAAAAGALERIANHARRIVFLTAPLRTPHPFFQQPNPSRATAEHVERLIEASGLEWTFLRAGMFAGNARHFWGPQILAGGVVRWAYLDVPTAPIDERDVAAAAVRLLGEDRHAGAEYVVTGPQSLTQAEQIDRPRDWTAAARRSDVARGGAIGAAPCPRFAGLHRYAAQRLGRGGWPTGVRHVQVCGADRSTAANLLPMGR